MKRILATASLTAMLATGAFAQTEAQITEVQRFLPNVNVALLDDETISQLVTIAYSDQSEADRELEMRAIINGGDTVDATFTEAQLVDIRTAAPEVDISAMTDAQILQALSIINSSDEGDASLKIRAIVDGTDETSLMLTDAEIQDIRLVAPEFDLTTVDADEAAQLRAAVASGDRDEIEAVISRIEAM